MHDQINEAKERLATLAVHDELTGLYNYRYLQTRLNEEFKRAERYREPLSCVMIDVDHFKRVNDRFGHDAGDRALREVPRGCSKPCAKSTWSRATAARSSCCAAEHELLRRALGRGTRVARNRQRRFALPDTTERITASVGVAVYPSRDIRAKISWSKPRTARCTKPSTKAATVSASFNTRATSTAPNRCGRRIDQSLASTGSGCRPDVRRPNQ